MILIEFTGVQGSGKSVAVCVLKKELKRQGINIVNLDDLVIRKVRQYPVIDILIRSLSEKVGIKIANFWYRFLRLKKTYQVRFRDSWSELVSYYDEYNNKRQISDKNKKKLYRWFIQNGGRYQMATELCQDQEVFVLDEGFFHRMLNLYLDVNENVPDILSIKQYLELIPHIDLLCEIKVNKTIAHNRVIRRGKPERFMHINDDDFINIIDKSQNIIDIGMSIIKSKTIQINNMIDFTNSEEVYQELSDQFGLVNFKKLLL